MRIPKSVAIDTWSFRFVASGYKPPDGSDNALVVTFTLSRARFEGNYSRYYNKDKW
jgi:hypothetical protein